MARTTRNRTGTGQLLLLAALLLGIVTMHTLGHPSQPTSDTATASAPTAAPVPAAASVTSHGADHDADPGAGPRGGHDTRVAAPAPDSPHGMTHDGHGGMSMDPLSVCLAVLGAFTLVVLVRAGLWRPGGTLARAPAAGRLLCGPRPEPPPVVLSRLSVLRL